MNWVVVAHETIPSPNLFSPPPPPPPPPQVYQQTTSLERHLENKISPSILLIIVILAVIFFISGLLHLLVRFLLKPTIRFREAQDHPDNNDHLSTAFQGQLQQLFHLHDSGVDQSFIDTLPLFLYKAIIGIKDPFDCAVCLCEFEPDDKLRLLPKCSHAFHIECIDTWLLAHSTCPLCRTNLLPDNDDDDFSPNNNTCTPLVFVLESGRSTEASFREIIHGSSRRVDDENVDDDDDDDDDAENSMKTGEDLPSSVLDVSEATKVVQVKLGKFCNVDVSEVGSTSSLNNSRLDQRRCFSMGSYEYVMNEASLLQVAIKPSTKKKQTGRSNKKILARSRLAMSECDFHSVREGFKGFVVDSSSTKSSLEPSARISSTGKKESFSISKIWMRQKKEKPVMSSSVVDNSRRAFSFRLPVTVNDESMAKGSSGSVSGLFEVGSEVDLEMMEVGSCNNSVVSMGSQIGEAPSFARRTLMWIVGRQNKVGSHL